MSIRITSCDVASDVAAGGQNDKVAIRNMGDLMRLIAFLLFVFAGPAVAHAEWHEASSRHFVVIADQEPAKVKHIAEQLEMFDKAMRVSHGVEDAPVSPANRVTVYFVANQREVARLAGGPSVYGFYIPRAGGSMAVVPSRSREELPAYNVLMHEYAHHFMFSIVDAAVPIWFSEGFSEFWSTLRFEDDGSVMVGSPPQARAAGLFGIRPLPLRRLLTYRKGEISIDAVYGQGWLLTHYLMFEPKRAGQLSAYIGAINRGEALEKAAEAFGDLNALERELGAHLQRRVFPGSKLPADRLKIEPVTVRKLTPGEAATIDVRIESKRGVTPDQAKRLVGRARDDAAAYPNDPSAQIVLAEAEYDAGNHAAAEQAADRALAADPKAKDALLYKAMARMGAAKVAKADGATPVDWRAIRRTIIAANRIEPDDPKPLELFYRSYVEAGEAIPEGARLGLIRAQELAPSDVDLRVQTARMLIWNKEFDRAKDMLGVIAFTPHRGVQAERARGAIDAIDRGETPEQIVAALDKKAEKDAAQSRQD